MISYLNGRRAAVQRIRLRSGLALLRVAIIRCAPVACLPRVMVVVRFDQGLTCEIQTGVYIIYMSSTTITSCQIRDIWVYTPISLDVAFSTLFNPGNAIQSHLITSLNQYLSPPQIKIKSSLAVA